MKATAIAPANIAFIKCWGKKDDVLRLPLNSSFSMNLSGAFTTTSVDFSASYKKDIVELVDGTFSQKETERTVSHLEAIRKYLGVSTFARIETKNSFPKGAGAAASASGFAALTVAAFASAGKEVSEKELTIFARRGSGSACRSIPDGFVLWKYGETSEDSYAHSVYPASHWDLRDVLVFVDTSMKKVPTTEGMENIKTSPFWQERVAGIPKKIRKTKEAFDEKNFSLLGEIIEAECVNMHAVMMTQNPPLFYWNETTMKIIQEVKEWRAAGLPVYFTIDAGPNVHLLCEAKNEHVVTEKARAISDVQLVLINSPAQGAHLL